MVAMIITSAARILTDEGYEGFTTNKVAEIAGISVGSLYQYFPNKNALIAELSRKHIEDLRSSIATTSAVSDGSTIETVVRQLVRNHIEIHQVEPELHRVLSSEIPKLGHFDWQSELIGDIQQRLLKLLRVFPETRSLPNPEHIVFVLINCVEAVVHSAISERPDEIDSGEIEDTLVRLVIGVLTGAGLP